jgi:hypothetical protein
MKRAFATDTSQISAKKLKLVTLDYLYQRTLAHRRTRELINSLTTELDGSNVLSEGTRELIMRAAVLWSTLRIARRSFYRANLNHAPRDAFLYVC